MIGSYVFQEGTVVAPHEMDMLSRVHKRLCLAKNIPAKGQAAENEAAHLVALFSDGFTTEDLLWKAVAVDP